MNMRTILSELYNILSILSRVILVVVPIFHLIFRILIVIATIYVLAERGVKFDGAMNFIVMIGSFIFICNPYYPRIREVYYLLVEKFNARREDNEEV